MNTLSFSHIWRIARHVATALLSVCIGTVGLGFGQAQNVRQSSAPHSPLSRPLVDGAVHPEQIPETDAIRMFMLAFVASPSNTAELKWQKVRLKSLNFSDNDRQLFIAAVGDLSVKVLSIRQQASTALQRLSRASDKTAIGTVLQPLHTSITDVTFNAYKGLMGHLSLEGRQSLAAQLASAKKANENF